MGGVLTKGMLICYNTLMKNKTLKNLIALGIFAIFVVGVNSANAQDIGLRPYSPYYSSAAPVYQNTDQNYYQNGYTYDSSSVYSNNNNNSNNSIQYNYGQQQPYAYAYAQAQPQVQYVAQPQQQVQYVAQPATQVIKYVPVETVKYVTTGTTNTVPVNTQGASVLGASVVRTGTPVTNTNSGLVRNSGQYVNYDANSQTLGASAYGVYSDQQVAYDNNSNGVAALTVGGTGGFMPSSVFQWFMLILLILAIIIVARMVSKTFSKNQHTAVAH